MSAHGQGAMARLGAKLLNLDTEFFSELQVKFTEKVSGGKGWGWVKGRLIVALHGYMDKMLATLMLPA